MFFSILRAMALLFPWKEGKVWVGGKKEKARSKDSYSPELEQNPTKPGRAQRWCHSRKPETSPVEVTTFKAHLKLLWAGEKSVAAIH